MYKITGNRLADFDVLVASDVIDPSQSGDKQLCEHVEGSVPEGGWMEFYCKSFNHRKVKLLIVSWLKLCFVSEFEVMF